jgi:hypothetical protein
LKRFPAYDGGKCQYGKYGKNAWRETEHAHVDDFSQAYIPHMDKENGILISLNIECDKRA